VSAGGSLEPLLLGKMPLTALPLVEELHARGVLADPLLRPEYLDHPAASRRLAHIHEADSLAALVGGVA
jgi:hypothetical protein